MNLTITRENLAKSLSAVSGSIAPRSSLPVLSNVLLEPEEGGLWVSATNLDVTIRARVHADATEMSPITAPGKKLQELTRELPKAPVSLTSKGDQLEVTCGQSRFKLNGLPSEEFPGLPEIDFESAWKITRESLQQLVDHTAFAVSGEESRPILNGVFWELKADKMVMAATNGHRLARMAIPAESSDQQDGSFIVSPAALLQVGKLFENTEVLSVARTGNYLAFRSPDAEMYTRLIEGKYPNYEQVIPKDNDKIASVERDEMIAALRRMAVVASEPPYRTKLVLKPGRMRLEVTTSDLGEAADEVDMEYEAEHQQMGFNSRYLLEVLRNMPKGSVKFAFKSPERAATVEPGDGEMEYLCLVMPLRLD